MANYTSGVIVIVNNGDKDLVTLYKVKDMLAEHVIILDCSEMNGGLDIGCEFKWSGEMRLGDANVLQLTKDYDVNIIMDEYDPNGHNLHIVYVDGEETTRDEEHFSELTCPYCGELIEVTNGITTDLIYCDFCDFHLGEIVDELEFYGYDEGAMEIVKDFAYKDYCLSNGDVLSLHEFIITVFKDEPFRQIYVLDRFKDNDCVISYFS